MIYEHEDNRGLKIVEFGHGTVRINPTNDANTNICNGIALIHSDTSHTIGERSDADKGRGVEEFPNTVFLKFTNSDSIDILMEELAIVKYGMINNLNTDEAEERLLAEEENE